MSPRTRDSQTPNLKDADPPDADRSPADRRLSRALEPDAASVERISRAALAADGRRPSRRARRVAWVATASALSFALALALWMGRGRPAQPAGVATPPATILITNQGGVLTVRDRGGRVWLRQGSGEPSGSGPHLVILKGDTDA